MGVRERTARALLRQVTAARSSLQQAPSLAAGAVTVAPSSSPAVAAPPARGLAALARPPPLPGSLLSAALPSAGCGTAAWLELRLGQPRRGLAHKGKGKGKGGAAAVADTSGAEAAEFDVGELEAEVDKCVDHFQHELSNLRSGRATAEMLDFVQVGQSQTLTPPPPLPPPHPPTSHTRYTPSARNWGLVVGIGVRQVRLNIYTTELNTVL